jgi:hypothetical protein
MENTKKRDRNAVNATTLLIVPPEALPFALELIKKDCPGAKITVYLPR